MSHDNICGASAHAALWDALWQRHASELSFREIRQGLVALSQAYVQKRTTLARGAARGRGKQAAFALSYAPRHLVLIEHIVATLAQHGTLIPSQETLFDLGCGTGVGGAAWALVARRSGAHVPRLVGVDTDGWALGEARWLYGTLGLVGRTIKGSLERVSMSPPGAIVAAYALNELAPATREALWQRLCALWARGMAVLIIEPIARGIAPYLPAWAAQMQGHGALLDEWRLRVALSEQLELLSRAARLDHRELTARSLFLPAPAASVNS